MAYLVFRSLELSKGGRGLLYKHLSPMFNHVSFVLFSAPAAPPPTADPDAPVDAVAAASVFATGSHLESAISGIMEMGFPRVNTILSQHSTSVLDSHPTPSNTISHEDPTHLFSEACSSPPVFLQGFSHNFSCKGVLSVSRIVPVLCMLAKVLG